MNRGNRRTLLWAGLAVCGSLILHGLLLLLPGLRTPSSEPATVLDITLLRLPEPVPQAVADPSPEPPRPPEAVEEEPEAPSIAAEPADQTPRESDPEIALARPPIITARQVLDAVRSADSPVAPSAPTTLEPTRIPALPDTPGWLNDYTGTVPPSIDRWVGNDGSRSTRMVLHNGQVICGRARPPDSAEMFNPSLATGVMLFRDCGRERPAPVDRTNPWMRAPGVP